MCTRAYTSWLENFFGPIRNFVLVGFVMRVTQSLQRNSLYLRVGLCCRVVFFFFFLKLYLYILR